MDYAFFTAGQRSAFKRIVSTRSRQLPIFPGMYGRASRGSIDAISTSNLLLLVEANYTAAVREGRHSVTFACMECARDDRDALTDTEVPLH